VNFGARLTQRYIAAIRWFIPLEVREDAATLTRAQNVINAVVMAALSGPFYAFAYHALGYGAAARVILTCCAGMFVAPFLMRATKSIVVAREAFLCAVFFNFSWLTYAMGGVSAPTAGWMVVPPMVAMFLGGLATAMFWLGLTCATVALIYALPLLNIPLPSNPIEDMSLLYLLCDLGLYVVIVLFVILFEVTKTQGFIKLQHALDFIHELALRDTLTGSHKRRHVLRLAADEREHAAAGATHFSLCLLEVDHFRRINDVHGIGGGDAVLREVAQCIKARLREHDTVGRYGAAQFLLLLPATAQEAALPFAEGLRQAVQGLRFGAMPAPAVTVSIGLAQFRPGESIDQTIARADEALVQATVGGRNRVAAFGQTDGQAAPAGAEHHSPGLADTSRTDALTGLLSRRVLRDRLGHAMARTLRNGRQVALMRLTLNRIEELRAALGVQGGDEILVQAAGQVRACLHVADTIVRWSGDEFIVILEDLRGADEAQGAARKILDRFAFPLVVAERECFVTLAIGIALFPAPSCDMDTLLERAGRAMQRAAHWGGNSVELYAPEAALASGGEPALKNELRAALAGGALLLAYQPQVDLAGGQLAGVQALIGWDHPRLGRLDAARLMPLAEEAGLALPLGEWILRSACLQNAAWRAAGLPALRTTVNLSGRQLAHPGMAESILAIIKETRIEPRCLDLEIAEDALPGEQLLKGALLGRLRRAGVRISIAGFGTGGASLHTLAELPLDILKLDRSFVARLGQPEQDESAWALAESIIHMAHRLQLGVVAEAVESAAQLADLRAMGCDVVQGDYLGRPAGADDIAQLFKRPRIIPLAAA
jgi:diguanylate cyclase (GGDEF)-like protein